jgi:hypothetical protein
MRTPIETQATTAKPKVYKPVGRCIYCGSTDTLSTEHIIPTGIRGRFILPQGSCEKCRKITQEFETTCLRKNFWFYRIHTGLQRHKKERPDRLPLRVAGQNQWVSPTAHPNLLIMPRMIEPGILTDAAPGMPYVIKWRRFGDLQALAEITKRHDGPVSVDYTFNIDSFVRMLAKIAHGYIAAELHEVGEFSETIFRPYLTDFIRGVNLSLGPYLVGQSKIMPEPPINKKFLHVLLPSILLHRDRYLVLIGVRLFQNWRGLVYTVITGELVSPPKNFLTRYGLSSELPRIEAALRRRSDIPSDRQQLSAPSLPIRPFQHEQVRHTARG